MARHRFLIPLVLPLILFLASPAAGQPYFTEVTGAAGISWLSSRSAAWGDYDNDGWPDLFVTNNNNGGTARGRVALWRNSGDGRFVDLGGARLPDRTHQAAGGGAVFGDYDNDGDLDLFVPCGHFVSRAANLLLRNDRGVFRDVALEAGLTDDLGTDNAVWLDYDRDGFLDLYAANLILGQPQLRNRLYRSRGDGTFEEVTEEAGLEVPLQECCGGSNGGMAAGDFNDDGWPDLYLGAWRSPNRLFLNDGQGHFRDATTGEIGDPGQAHGIAVGDIDNDGDLDIFQAAGGGMAELLRSPLLLNAGNGQFLDVTEAVGLGGLGVTSVEGTGMGDIDNDGDLDLLTADPPALYLNDGTGLLVDYTSYYGIDRTGTVLAFGDYDLDGFLDVVLGTGPGSGWGTVPFGRLYHNNGNGNHYLRVELVHQFESNGTYHAVQAAWDWGCSSQRYWDALAGHLLLSAADARDARRSGVPGG